MKSYLLSSLRNTFARKEERELLRAHPHHWLLWEPGSWRPAAGATVTVEPGRVPGLEPPPSSEADGLVLALIPKPGAKELQLGRGLRCDLVINDGTVSTVHLLLRQQPSGWGVRDAGSRNGTRMDGAKLPQELTVRLHDGAKLQLGRVHLTHYTPTGLMGRLAAAPLPAPAGSQPQGKSK